MAELRPDPNNANKGSVRGRGMLERSLSQYGAGRAPVASADGVILAGNNYIYTLSDPDTGEVRYVGKTDNPNRRLAVHYASCETGDSYVQRWVRSLRHAGKRPVMTLIETCGDDEWPDRERYWIAHYQQNGARLTNSREGGVGGMFALRPESREKISQARTGMRFTPEHRQRLRERKQELWASERGMEIRNGYSRQYAALTDEQVLEIWRLATTRAMTQIAIAKMFGIPDSTVSEIKTGKRYKHVPRPEKAQP